jgi:tRNA uridine 5-carbamoylmethylation protein Kti12
MEATNSKENEDLILYLLRGVSGSGKSYLAKQLLSKSLNNENNDKIKNKGVILSTDEFFMEGDVYNFNNHSLQKAHAWNQVRCEISMENKLSPIIMYVFIIVYL